MKTTKNIIWGICLILLGIILCINALEIFKIDIFFDGWWTLFIIVPSIIGLCTEKDKLGSAITLIVGVLLLLACQDLISFAVLGKLIFPIIIVCVGFSLLFKSTIRPEQFAQTTDSKEEYTAIFAGQDVKIDNKEFKGTSIKAIFGGVKLDLRKAVIKKDIVINCNAIFGGVDIYVPEDVKVEVRSSSIFGGVDNKTTSDKKGITVYVDATCVFGGVDIK